MTTPEPSTRDKILNIAQDFLETRGFNAFSYQDIADKLGIKKASLHYHFPSKADLGAALAQRHADRAKSILAEVDAAGLAPCQKLDAFIKPFADFAQSCEHMCPSGMLAAEFSTLDPTVQRAMSGFFSTIHTWLAGVLQHGRASGDFAFDGDAATRADLIISTLEGAILLARVRQSAAFFTPLTQEIKTSLGC